MATAEEQNLAQFKETYQQVTPGIPGAKHEGGLFGNARKAAEGVASIVNDLKDGLSERILTHKVKWYGFDGKTQPEGARDTVTLASVIGWYDSGQTTLNTKLDAINEKLDRLLADREEGAK